MEPIWIWMLQRQLEIALEVGNGGGLFGDERMKGSRIGNIEQKRGE